MTTAERTVEFTWTRPETIALMRVVTRPALVTTIVAFGIGGIAVGWMTGSTRSGGVMLIIGAILVARNVLRPGHLWNHHHPAVTGTHRVSWDDEVVRVDNPASSVELRAGSLIKVEGASGLILLRGRTSAFFRGIPTRCFADERQRADLVEVARSLAASKASVDAAAQERRSRQLSAGVTAAILVAVLALIEVRR